MLLRSSRRIFSVASPLLILILISTYYLYSDRHVFPGAPTDTPIDTIKTTSPPKDANTQPPKADPPAKSTSVTSKPPATDDGLPERIIYSLSTTDKKYFPINFGEYLSMNPNLIPHHNRKDVWIISAMKVRHQGEISMWNSELTCDALFVNGTLTCEKPPFILTIANTPGNNCHGEGLMGVLGESIGPHDGRVFYGPKHPYTIYGSNSQLTCFGMWIQDFRPLVDWGANTMRQDPLMAATEMQRPGGKYLEIEKNWFVFWDFEDKMYAHHDIAPTRVFAKMENDGSVGKDLAEITRPADDKCLKKYLPAVKKGESSIHQATNSLSITMCKRADPNCKIDETNTFVFTIFQHKSYFAWHGDYHPYVMMFQRKAPFAIHGISKRPFWIHGCEKGKKGEKGNVKVLEGEPNVRPLDQNEMVYITSMSWKSSEQKYHGYLDDVLILAFGVEDIKSGGMDILAGDIIEDVGSC